MAGAPAFDASPVTQRTAEEDVAHMRSQIDSRRQALYATSELREYWHKLWEGLCKHRPVPQHLWCLGIGPFSHPASAYQWAVLLEFQDALKVSMTAVLTAQSYHNRSVPLTVYDPQFASRDIALVKSLGAQLPPSNKCGAYEFQQATLIYMPHCPKELYEALLRANWNQQRLQTLILCGNELDMYPQHDSIPCISRIAPHVKSYALPTIPTHVPGALNGAVQVFFSTLPDMPCTTSNDGWSYQPAPRKSRARARRARVPEKPTSPLDIEDPAFWRLPPPAPTGEEVLTTPVPDGSM